MIKFLKNNKKYIWWLVTVGLFGIAGLLLVPIANYIIKLANRYPNLFKWIVVIVCICGLFIEDRNTSFVILCLVVAITSNKLSNGSR